MRAKPLRLQFSADQWERWSAALDSALDLPFLGEAAYPAIRELREALKTVRTEWPSATSVEEEVVS